MSPMRHTTTEKKTTKRTFLLADEGEEEWKYIIRFFVDRIPVKREWQIIIIASSAPAPAPAAVFEQPTTITSTEINPV